MITVSTSAFSQWIRRQAEVITAISIILGAMTALIVFFGGSIPPWYTPAKAAEDQRTNARIQEKTVQTLSQVTDKLNSLQRRLDIRDCYTLADTLEKAKAALMKTPDDPLALALRDTTELQMRQTQNCAP